MPKRLHPTLRAMALAAMLVSPVWAKGFPWKENLVTVQGSTIVSLAKDGKTQWQATFGASGPLEIIPDSNAPWLASGDQLWAFDPAQGKEVWRTTMGGPTAFPPQVVSPRAWAISWKVKEDWTIALIAKEDGKQLWSRTCSAKPVVLSDDDATPLILQTGSELIALGGDEALWTAQQSFERRWITRDQVILQGKDQLTCLARATGKELWRFPLPSLTPTPTGSFPTGLEIAVGSEVAIQVQDLNGQSLTCLDPQTGKVIWQQPSVPSMKPFMNWEGPLLIHRVAENVEALDSLTGRSQYTVRLNSFTTQTLAWKGHLIILGRFSFPETALDPSGQPILEIATRAPRKELVDGFVSHLDGLPFVTDTRSPCKMQVVGDTLIYSSKTRPMRDIGVPLRIDPLAPTPPLILHGLNSTQGESWRWEPKNPSERAKWAVVDGHVILFHQNQSISELAASNGTTLWKSPPLNLGENSPRLTFTEQGLWVESEAAQVYFLDKEGKVKAHWDMRPGFDPKKSFHLLSLLLLSGAIAYYIWVARSRKLFIRKIAGLEAIDEAVGRATEMGRPVLYVPGLEDIDEIQTLASLSILSHVARRTAEYDTEILVPTRRAVVMSTAQEVVREAYTLAGRPDAFISDNIRYLTDDQFGFVAGVDGIMLREKPAANFYMGMFYGEALILAETGFSTGAIQIAGTAAPSQLPFFVATCDYTLMGEELYAASAYLSQDPLQVGSLRGQDVGKALVMATLVTGTILQSFGIPLVKMWLK